MLRKYCFENDKNGDEGIPFSLFRACESAQELLGFSSAEFVFGHTVQGPLKMLKDRFLSGELSSETNVPLCEQFS